VAALRKLFAALRPGVNRRGRQSRSAPGGI